MILPYKIPDHDFKHFPLDSAEGKALFDSFTSNTKNQDCFQKLSSFNTSYGYYLITGRKKASILGNKNAILIQCEHPNIDNEHINYMPLYCEELLSYAEQKIDAKITKISRHFIDGSDDFATENETVMDWVYPTYHYSTQELSELKGGKYRKLRYCLYQFDDKKISFRLNAKIQPKVLMKWALKQAKKIDASQPGLSQEEIFNTLLEGVKIIETNKNTYQTAMIEIDETPVAYIAWDLSNDQQANLLWLVYDNTVTEISRLSYLKLAEHLNENGIKTLCPGGSETKSLDLFKRQFKPIQRFNYANVIVKSVENQKQKAA